VEVLRLEITVYEMFVTWVKVACSDVSVPLGYEAMSLGN
jgi:hypothetical protein